MHRYWKGEKTLSNIYAMHIVQYTMNIVQCTILQCTMYIHTQRVSCTIFCFLIYTCTNMHTMSKNKFTYTHIYMQHTYKLFIYIGIP